ncbi:unnamed protein product [Calicophoron daubneyi]|uniref:Uncharacterized protein n=1 Tax=Calicophoron daubneyi TaxID=300641 RepID=A0AAV2TU85_CALDB
MWCAFIYLVTIPLLAFSDVSHVRLELGLKRYENWDVWRPSTKSTVGESHWSDFDWGCYPSFELLLLSPGVPRSIRFYCDKHEPNHEREAYFGRQITSSLSNPFIFDTYPPSLDSKITFEWIVFERKNTTHISESLNWKVWIEPNESVAYYRRLKLWGSETQLELEYRLYCTPGYFGVFCQNKIRKHWRPPQVPLQLIGGMPN